MPEERISISQHPAKFSDKVLAEIKGVVTHYASEHPGWPLQLLDPFAGVGKIHQLADPEMIHTVGVEIEPEWALNHPNTIVGDSRSLPIEWTDHFDLVVTSPSYANRMADHHEAREKCKICNGTGIYGALVCEKCDGKGRRTYKRNTYRHVLGRPLTEGNSGMMQWGDEYRALHEQVWQEVARVLKPGGLFILNVSDHIRKKRVVQVAQWHLDTCLALGFEHDHSIEVKTPRNRYGENRDLRVDHEMIFVLKAPLD